MRELISQLEAGCFPDIGDIGGFDHPAGCGPEVMPRLLELAAQVAGLPQSCPFMARGTFLRPIFGRLNDRGAYALLACRPRLHVPRVRRSIEVNGGS
jgi:hypothetical protein